MTTMPHGLFDRGASFGIASKVHAKPLSFPVAIAATGSRFIGIRRVAARPIVGLVHLLRLTAMLLMRIAIYLVDYAVYVVFEHLLAIVAAIAMVFGIFHSDRKFTVKH